MKAENKALKIENAELKERLGLNSKNSSLPSSRELYKIKKDKPRATVVVRLVIKEVSVPKWMQMR